MAGGPSAEEEPMPVTASDIAAGLRALGLPAGATVLVHSSLRSFGQVEGGADAVIDGILQALGPTGTAAFPTFSGSSKLGPEHPPHFDVRQTPCWTGRIPETARDRAEARRSLHPTHSVAAMGPGTADLLHDHELSPTPCGPETPFGRLARCERGYVLFLGADLSSNTMFHHVEEAAKVDYHMQEVPVAATVVDYEGETRTVRLWLHRYGPARDYPKAEPYLRERGILTSGRIGESTVRLVRSRPMVEYVLARVSEDPDYLLATRKTPA